MWVFLTHRLVTYIFQDLLIYLCWDVMSLEGKWAEKSAKDIGDGEIENNEVKHCHQTLKKPNQTKVAIKSVYEKTCMIHLFCSGTTCANRTVPGSCHYCHFQPLGSISTPSHPPLWGIAKSATIWKNSHSQEWVTTQWASCALHIIENVISMCCFIPGLK